MRQKGGGSSPGAGGGAGWKYGWVARSRARRRSRLAARSAANRADLFCARVRRRRGIIAARSPGWSSTTGRVRTGAVGTQSEGNSAALPGVVT